jgi:hypothetical protein
MPDSSNPVPEQGDYDRAILWDRKAFYVVKTPVLLYQPLQLHKDIERALDEARREGYLIPPHPMVMYGMELFSGEVLVEVNGVVTPTRHVRVFNDVPVYATVTKGSTRELKRITREFFRRLREQGKEVTQVYYWMKNNTDPRENTVLLALES